MKLIAIVAATENNVIGIGNEMPWHLPDDFKFFKEKTLGFPILMGSNTWRTLGKALKGRENIIISRSMKSAKDGIVFDEIDKAIDYCKEKNEETIFIIGGGEIYKQIFKQLDEIFMTRIHTEINGGEVFFPEIKEQEWNKVWEQYHPTDERHKYDFTFQLWKRK